MYDYQLDAHEAHSSHVHAAGSSLGGAASSLESRQQRQPLVKRLADIFMSQGLVALLEDLRSLEKAKAGSLLFFLLMIFFVSLRSLCPHVCLSLSLSHTQCHNCRRLCSPHHVGCSSSSTQSTHRLIRGSCQ